MAIFGPKTPPLFGMGPKFGQTNIRARFQGRLVTNVMQLLEVFLLISPVNSLFGQFWPIRAIFGHILEGKKDFALIFF